MDQQETLDGRFEERRCRRRARAHPAHGDDSGDLQQAGRVAPRESLDHPEHDAPLPDPVGPRPHDGGGEDLARDG